MLQLAPPVSIVIPAYNGSKTIVRALESITKQRFRPLQVIVVDDASIDGTPQLAENFLRDNFPRSGSKTIRHDRNQGLSRSLNDGLQHSGGDFILLLHQDCELVGEEWIEKAVSMMRDDKVGVVTGYYGITDQEDSTFVKRSFGLLRRQFHSKPKVPIEEVTFSEGKCDLYRRSLLLKIGGFPESFRIAGEDLITSYLLRQMGYQILKAYELSTVQRFTGKSETFHGNIQKEFLFGKAMGGVFSRYRLFLFRGLRSSNYSKARSLHRASQPLFVVFLVGSAILATVSGGLFTYLTIAVLISRIVYYFLTVTTELGKSGLGVIRMTFEGVTVALIGITTDFAYSFGFAFGLARYCLGLEL